MLASAHGAGDRESGGDGNGAEKASDSENTLYYRWNSTGRLASRGPPGRE